MRKISNHRSQKQHRRDLRNNLTVQEVILWSRLKQNQMGLKFRRQYGIGKYIVDFCCPAIKLIVEIDGKEHLDRREYDGNRDAFLKKQGYKVLRFWNNEINTNLNGVIMRIGDVITPPRPDFRRGTPPQRGGEETS